MDRHAPFLRAGPQYFFPNPLICMPMTALSECVRFLRNFSLSLSLSLSQLHEGVGRDTNDYVSPSLPFSFSLHIYLGVLCL